MKKYILLLFSFLLINTICFGQTGWVSKFFNNTNTVLKILERDSLNYLGLCVNSKYYYKSSDAGNTWLCIQNYSFDSVYSFFDGQFLNSLTGWIVGSNSQYYDGAIFKTTDGGLNWNRQITGFNIYDCYRLCFLNTNTGWVASSGGTTTGLLLKTIDGGSNWTKQDFPGAYRINGVKFFDSSNGWIIGTYGPCYRTTDGGQNWLQKPINNIPPSFILNSSLNALSVNECWALVISGNSGLIYSNFLKTINGGDNWSLMFSYTDSLNTGSASFSSINFINSLTGILNGGFNFIERTSNSGTNWNRINVAPLIGASPIISTIVIGNSETFAGGGYSGFGSYRPFNYIIKSSDIGLSWNVKSFNYEYRFFKTLFLDANFGFALSDSGKVFKTANAGNNWNPTFSNSSNYLRDISFANASTGCIVSGIRNNNSNKILRTTDSGNNWAEVFNTSKSLFSVKYFDDQNGWAGSDSNRIYRTTDAGLNWSMVTLTNSKPCEIIGMSFINNTTGWILGHNYYGYIFGSYEKNAIWKTTDGGNNWISVFDSLGFCYNLNLKFLDDNIGYKFSGSPNRIQKTTNGGSNWFNVTFPDMFYMSCIDFVNQNTGWAGGRSNGNGGGSLYKTTNSGSNWILQFNEYNKIVYSIDALDENNAWFCGDYSSIYSTTNGGGQIIGITPISNTIPNNFTLHQNYPNPFNPVTKIKFDISKSSLAKIIIYDILGREIATLLNEELKPGTYSVDWDGSNYASGIYFYKLAADDFVETKKIVLMK